MTNSHKFDLPTNSNFKNSVNFLLFISSFVFLLFAFSVDAFAGTGGSEFKTWVDTLIEYATGYPAMGVLAISLIIGAIKLTKGEPAIFGWTVVAGILVASFETVLGAMVTAIV